VPHGTAALLFPFLRLSLRLKGWLNSILLSHDRPCGVKIRVRLWVRNEELMISSIVKAFGQQEEGQDLVEYSLLLAFIALAAVALLGSAGNSISTIWTGINSQMTSAAAS
jgi:Flp pilus assembly pilin Flp